MNRKILFSIVIIIFASTKISYSQPNDCTGPNSEVHDDGTFENCYTLTGDSVRFIMKITPVDYPWAYKKICVGWTRFLSGPESLNYDIMVYHVKADGKPEYVFKEYLGQQVSNISVFPNVTWNSTNIDLPPLVAGSYYIGVRYVNNPNRDVFIASDESPSTIQVPAFATNHPDYYFHWIAADTQWQNYRSLAIRMTGEPGVDALSCINPVGAEIHDDGTLENGHTGYYDSTKLVIKMQPNEYPWLYTKVCIAWSKLYNYPDYPSFNYDIIVYDDNGPAGSPGDLVAIYPGQQVIKIPNFPVYKWNASEVNIPALYEGSYYIGLRMDCNPYPGVFVMFDASPETPLWYCYHFDPIKTWERNDSEWINFRSSAIRTEGSPLVGVIPISTEIPLTFVLEQNYPNPFNPQTKIHFELPKTAFTNLIIYDILGRELAIILNEELKPGTYEADWDGSNFSSGVYFYRLEAGDFTETKKMVLMK